MDRAITILDHLFTTGKLDYIDYDKAMNALMRDRDELLGIVENEEDYT